MESNDKCKLRSEQLDGNELLAGEIKDRIMLLIKINNTIKGLEDI